MKPYYSDELVSLYHGDFRDLLLNLTADWPKSFGWADCAMCDPPYGETSLHWDTWPERWPLDVLPYLKPTGSRMFMKRRDDFAGYRMSQEVVWEKHNGSGFANDRFRRVHELAAHFYPASSKWADVYKSPQFTLDATARTVAKRAKAAEFHGATGETTYATTDGGPRLMRSVIYERSMHRMAINETQKPVNVVTPLIAYACPPGGTVLVPFVGSGTDLLAARSLDMRAIGFEVRESQCEAAAQRLADRTLFNIKPTTAEAVLA